MFVTFDVRSGIVNLFSSTVLTKRRRRYCLESDGLFSFLAFLSFERAPLSVADYPDFLIQGPTHAEFEDLVRDLVDYHMPRIPDQTLREDFVQTLTWYYSPWPHIDDRDLNRRQFSMVSGE